MTLLVATAAGAVGSVCRYLVADWAQRRSRSGFPIGTATVNLAGALLVGVVAGSVDLEAAPGVALVGFTGGFTTFSTWMIETVRLGAAPRLGGRAAANLVLLAVLGVALTAAGFHLTN